MTGFLPFLSFSTFLPHILQYHRELLIRIDTLTNLGMGIARVNLADFIETHDLEPKIDNDITVDKDDNQHSEEEEPKWVVMVPNVIPGELVKARIFRNHKSYSEADLMEIVEPSPDRIEPKCPLAGECGGCQYQHMPIELQREWKAKHVEECFRQHKVDLESFGIQVESTMGTEHTYHYRSKITPHYQAPGGQSRKRGRKRRRKQKTEPQDTTQQLSEDEQQPSLPSVEAIGFQRSSVRKIIDVPHCPIATEPLNKEYQRIREELLNQPYHQELGATLLLRQANLDNGTVVLDHKEYMTTYVNGLSFTYMAGNFFQNNLHILPQMVDVSMEKASPPVNGQKMTHFVDCYCGSGLFCLSAANYFDTCVGIEINAKAIEEAERNAESNGLSHKCTFEAARAENIFDNPNVQSFPRDTTVVMLDPPRKGCDELFLNQLAKFRPVRIVYMSCNPATQARDVNEMVSWGYKISFVQPIDLFPQTRHIECLTVLERVN